VKEGPLDAARNTVERYGIQDKVELVLSDGLENVDLSGVTDVIIAGMGGETIAEIIGNSTADKPDDMRFILQPMTKSELLRKKLYEYQYEITAEYAVEEKDKIYVIMAVIIMLLLTAGIIFAVRMIRKQRTSMDTQLNKLMAEISRFKEKEMEKETVEPSKLPRERVLTESERHFLEEIMATATKLMRTYSVTVEKVADDMCMTPKTLNRKVMDLTGISTKQYLLLTQLEQSRRILVDEHDVPIAEVSLRCGFENSNTFSGAFRRVYGVSPSEFRRKES
jgi:tRNA A22 N-methylase